MTRVIDTDEVRFLFTAGHMAAVIATEDPFQDQVDAEHGGVRYVTGETSERVETSFALTFGYEDCPAASLDGPFEPDMPFAENE